MSRKSFQVQDILLYPLSIFYGLVIWIRNRLFDYQIIKSEEFPIPIISVGNITVGGTGKTPHVEYLIRTLKDEFKVAMLSRGYKRKSIGFVLGTNNSTASEIGDEPRQIKQKFPDTTIAIDGNRVRAINKLLLIDKDLKVIILDDGFQHRYVSPGLSVLLIDYNNLLKDDALLPYGRLRETSSERRRADIIILSKCPAVIRPIDQRLLELEIKKFAYQKVFFTTIKYGSPLPVFKGFAKSISFEIIKETNPVIFLITGIANTSTLKSFLAEMNVRIVDLKYPDHYDYTAKDLHGLIEKFSLESNKQKIIITTEKDAMKLEEFVDLDEEIKAILYYIPIWVEFLDNQDKIFNQIINNYVRNNKPDNILHQQKNKKQT